jgi:NADH-quinone oxidoreductase subunit E
MTTATSLHQIIVPPPAVELPEALREKILACTIKYPMVRSGLLAALYEVQHHYGFVPEGALGPVADIFDLGAADVQGVVSFYTMYHRQPVGRFVLQFCRTLPCHLRGYRDVEQFVLVELGIKLGGTTPDGLFTVIEVECIGACSDAPAMLVNDDLYDNLTPDRVSKLLAGLRKQAAQEAAVDSKLRELTDGLDAATKKKISY